MHPVLIKLGPITIHSYGFMLALGVVAALLLSMSMAKKYNIDRKILADFYFYTIIIGLVGAKIFLLVTEANYYFEKLSRFKDLLFSGGTFYGGLIFGALFAVWFIKKHKLNFRIMGDIAAPAIALAHFFGRMGCFLAGCCWGRDAHGCSIAVEFTDHNLTTGVPRHAPVYPTQLIESLLNLANFVILLLLSRKKKYNGQVFALYIFNYSLIRFFVEYFRGDPDRGYVFGSWTHAFTSLSVPQLISIIGVITAVILFSRFRKQAKSEQV